MRRLLIGFVGMFLLMAGTAFSQDISGSIDGYYEYNFNRPNGANGTTAGINSLRAFDVNHAKMSLNYGELVVEKKPEKVGFRVDVGIGDTARIVNATEPNTNNNLQYIQQAYVSGKLSDKFQLDFGKFVTPMGSEVIETKDNWNYSRSLLFTYAIPFYHFGLRATIAKSDNVTIQGFLVNGWNNVTDNNTSKTAGISVALKGDKGKFMWTGNYMAGEEGKDGTSVRHMFDTIVMFDVTDMVSLMANYDYGTDGNTGGKADWKGVAAYAKISPTKKVKFIPRYEWFKDVDGFTTGTGQRLQEATITNQLAVADGTILWTEFRRDWNKKDTDPAIFPVKRNGITHYQNTVTIGLTYEFKKK